MTGSDAGVERIVRQRPDGMAGTAVRLEAQPSFTTFFGDERAGVVGLVLALRGDHVAAEDVAQEAFVRAYRRWDEVRAMERPDLWVRRVALNLATSRWRRLGSEARALVRLGGRAAHRDEPFAAVDGADAFWSAVRRLAPRQAQVVALTYVAEQSVAEVAATLGIAEGTVKSTLHDARRRLAELLEVRS